MLRPVATHKDALLTVKVAPHVLKDFKVAAELKGGTMSALVHMFVVQTIREQRELNPEAFRKRNEYERPLVTARVRAQSRKKQHRT